MKVVVILFFLWLSCAFCYAQEQEAEQVLTIKVSALFKSAALLKINDKEHFLKVGRVSPEGVKLIKANSKVAVVEINGKREKIKLNKSIGTYYRDAEKTTVRISAQDNGHFFGQARINGVLLGFMVDTGASAVVMNSKDARRVGLDYKKGRLTQVSTAQGRTNAYFIILASVNVGGITKLNVDALVLEGAFPEEILLGNSFLQHVNLKVDNGVLVLETKY